MQADERDTARPGRRESAALACIATVALALRLAAVLLVPTEPVSDFWSYFQRGINLADRGRYEAIPGRPSATFPPGYALLLSGVFRVTSDRLLAAKLTNCVLGAAAVILVGVLGRRLWGAPVGLVAAAVLALYPRAVFLPCLVASENLLTPLLLLFALVVAGLGSSRRPIRKAGAAGFIAGLMALTRQAAYPIAWLWPVVALVSGVKGVRRVALGTAASLTAAHLVLLPWGLWNARNLGQFNLLSSAGGIALYVANNPRATGRWYEWEGDFDKDPAFARLTPMERNDLVMRAARGWIAAHPVRFLAGYFRRLGQFFADGDQIGDWVALARDVSPPFPGRDVLPDRAWAKSHPALVHGVTWGANVAFWLGIVAGTGVLGFRIAREGWARHAPAVATLGVLSAGLSLPVAVFVVVSRYRWPLEDLLVPVVALSIVTCAGAVRPRHAPAMGGET